MHFVVNISGVGTWILGKHPHTHCFSSVEILFFPIPQTGSGQIIFGPESSLEKAFLKCKPFLSFLVSGSYRGVLSFWWPVFGFIEPCFILEVYASDKTQADTILNCFFLSVFSLINLQLSNHRKACLHLTKFKTSQPGVGLMKKNT